MKITRTFARANHLTFSIPPIKGLLERYVGSGVGWADPFARDSKVAELTNNIDTNTSAKFHLEALEFCNKIEGKLDGVLFDPPYSYRQISDHYKSVGLKEDWSKYKSVFVNPPFKHADKWVKKAYEESKKGCTVVVLIPVKSDTAWWHDYALKANEIRFVRGRVTFEGFKDSFIIGICFLIFKPSTPKRSEKV